MAKSGLKHIDVGPELTRTEWESEESHELLHGSSFPGSPVERQLFYRDDEHKWYIYDGSDWVWLGGGSGGGMVEHGNEYHDPDFATESALSSHTSAATGVHGVGAGTIAKVADIATDGNLSSAAQDAITKKHTQNTDKTITDADADTAWEVEHSADEDKIRGKVAGVEAFHLDAAGVLTLAKQSGCKAYLTGNQSTARGSYQKVNLNGEIYDIQSEFNTGTYKFTAKTAGLYLLIATATVVSLPVSQEFDVVIYKNGVEVAASVSYTPSTLTLTSQVSSVGFLAVNDYIELYVYIGGSGSLNIAAGEKNTNLFIAKIA